MSLESIIVTVIVVGAVLFLVKKFGKGSCCGGGKTPDGKDKGSCCGHDH